ncbi:MAG TPA: DUF3592 domain-containing protein [Actinomycetota bacterium]|nr:DUF3592 domain-containing protein [Actinomycetota bacterium]
MDIFVAIFGAIVGVVFLSVMLDYPVWTMWERYQLDRHGVLTEATVVKIEPEDTGGDGGGDPTLDVRITACNCVTKVDAAHDTHPVGSSILIRYDPNDPTRAIAVEDPPEVDPIVLLFIAGAIVWSAVSAWIKRGERSDA